MRSAAAVLLAIVVAALASASAEADVFGPISLASASAISGFSGNQQADYARDAAISGNGRFVAFDGSFGGLSGVWRRDLLTGAVVAVAAENLGEPSLSAPDADLPSISENGQYVSFTTTARLDPLDDTNFGPDVYVRDMSRAPGEEGAYTLASAVNEGVAALSYEPNGKNSSVEFEETVYGSVAAGRSALSADGRKVAFVTTVISNLAGPGTPALQVAVRDLDTERTELVSVAIDPGTGQPLPGQPVSGVEGSETFGAVFSGAGGKTPIFRDPEPYEPSAPVGASISADGSTVAWLAVDVSQQVRMLPAESPRASYTEPLWRRIGDGPTSPTRRIAGGPDPENPACTASGEQALPGTATLSDPCQGPFAATQLGGFGVWQGGSGDVIPRLSADGYSAAFLANAPLVARGAVVTEPKSDLYLADMHQGITRNAAVRPLTEIAGGDQNNIGENGPVEDLGIAADGRHVAFATKRTEFPLGSPAYISAPQVVPGMLELFDIDLADDTLTRVTQGFEGGPSEHPHEATTTGVDPYRRSADGALSPSYSNAGGLLAFSSTASNLTFGDGNTPPLGSGRFDGSDAFTVSRVIFSSIPTPQSVSSAPPGPSIVPSWRLGVTARSLADGSVALYVTVPGAGVLRAAAQGAVRVRVKRRGHVSSKLATKNVASASATVRTNVAALTTIKLKLSPAYRRLAARRPGLQGVVTVSFAAPHHPTLRQRVVASFLRVARVKAKKSRADKRKPGASKQARAASLAGGSR